MQCDISDFNKCSEFTNEVKDRFGSIDILVNNAGITRDGLCMAMKPNPVSYTHLDVYKRQPIPEPTLTPTL